jgi:hypothetical protein
VPRKKNGGSDPAGNHPRSRASAAAYPRRTPQPAGAGPRSGRDGRSFRYTPGRSRRANRLAAVRSTGPRAAPASLSLRFCGPLLGITLQTCADRSGVGGTTTPVVPMPRLPSGTIPG